MKNRSGMRSFPAGCAASEGQLQLFVAGVDSGPARQLTHLAVTQTRRFGAAVAGAGLSNWQSYYGQNSIDQWMIPYFGASVYDDPQVYAKSCPINFVKQAKTPTLVVVGERDGECPAPQSFEFWHALKTFGVPTQLVVYPGEGQSVARPQAGTTDARSIAVRK